MRLAFLSFASETLINTSNLLVGCQKQARHLISGRDNRISHLEHHETVFRENFKLSLRHAVYITFDQFFLENDWHVSRIRS
jgi:hypothetical protein